MIHLEAAVLTGSESSGPGLLATDCRGAACLGRPEPVGFQQFTPQLEL